jgi:stage II sporulation protein D
MASVRPIHHIVFALACLVLSASAKKKATGKAAAMPAPAAEQVAVVSPLPGATSVDERLLIREKKPARVTVRVCLRRVAEGESDTWHLTCPGGFIISDVAGKNDSLVIKENELTIRLHQGTIRVAGKRLRVASIRLRPARPEDLIQIDSHFYDGNCIITTFNGHHLLINNDIDLEQYVMRVLACEGWPGWPLEFNRAFAIVCRSYVMAQLVTARSKSKKAPYDLFATNDHQVYKGIITDERRRLFLTQAIEDTAGVVLAHNGKPIQAMYDICCGGVVPAHMQRDFIGAPYLKRSAACTFCQPTSVYEWTVRHDEHELLRMLDLDQGKHKELKELTVQRKDKAGLVREVVATTKRGRHSLKGSHVYARVKGIKSLCFTIKKVGRTFEFSGRGYGHHLGLCQWGAKQLIDQNWSYKQVLGFYYPNTVFMRVRAL